MKSTPHRSKPLLLILLAFVLTAAASAWADSISSSTRETLYKAIQYQIQFREGNTSIIPEYVQMLEYATSAEPDNADLWYAMGVAYFANTASMAMSASSIDMAAMAPLYQKGKAAIDRALQLNPQHAEAMALNAGTSLMMASFVKAPEVKARLLQKSVDQMNQAVAISPNSKRARLQRAFSGLTLPAELRNHEQEAADLQWLQGRAGNGRAGDYIKLLRADLYAELGDTREAKVLYRVVASSDSPAAAEASLRLDALNADRVPSESINALRVAAGSQCAMCHGK